LGIGAAIAGDGLDQRAARRGPAEQTAEPAVHDDRGAGHSTGELRARRGLVGHLHQPDHRTETGAQYPIFCRRPAAAPEGRDEEVLLDLNPLAAGHEYFRLGTFEVSPDHRLLAFLHVAEKSAAGRFAIYRQLVDDDPERIASALAEARMPTERPPLYGDGHASERIAAVLGSISSQR
jgi:hypothetical protein